MNMSILFLSILFLMSCAQDSSSPTSFNPADPSPVIAKVCQGQFQRSWLNSNRSIYNLYSNCTGTIPHCDAEFDYEIADNGSSFGTIKITLKKSLGVFGCPVAPAYTECRYKILSSGVNRGNMELTCDGSTEMYTPRGSLE